MELLPFSRAQPMLIYVNDSTPSRAGLLIFWRAPYNNVWIDRGRG